MIRAQRVLVFLIAFLGLLLKTSWAEEQLVNLTRLQMFVDELPQMPLLKGFDVVNGVPKPKSVKIGMYMKKWRFHRDLPPTPVFAYGTRKRTATVPGPTIEALQGIDTFVTWSNYLPSKHILPWDPTIPTALPVTNKGVPTVVHLHGGIHEPESDGSANAWFTADFKDRGPAWPNRRYRYRNQQHPGNLWYHDHAMGLTRVNLLAGLIGAYIVRHPEVEGALRLPSGEFDRTLVVFDRSFRTDGSIYMNPTGNNPSIHPQWQPEYFGDAIIVNGKAWPQLKVRRRKYRFRIINASNARFFKFFFTNGLRFIHVGSDSAYLGKPVETKDFLLGPSEITDVVVDFSESKNAKAILANGAPYPYPSGDPVNNANSKVMQFLIADHSELDASRVPSRLIQYPVPDISSSSRTRYIAMYEYTSDIGQNTKPAVRPPSTPSPAGVSFVSEGEREECCSGKMKMGQDMLVKILLTLPPKTLMRFKCVSKWWSALINNPGFVSNHLSNSANNNLTTLHVFLARLVVQRQHEEEEEENPKCNSTTKKGETEEVLSILEFCRDDDNTDDEHSNSCSLVGVQDIIIPQSLIQNIGVPEQQFRVHGHCNGIVLLSSESGLVLCNPGIGEFNRIPDEPCLPMWPLDQPDDYDQQEHMETGFHTGFGYDPMSNEYKVVTFTTYFQEVDERCRTFLSRHRAVVYTMGCDFWEEINTDSLETETTLFWPEDFQMYFKGMCYWLGIEQDKELFRFDAVEHRFHANGILIISFDTSREVFHGIPLPYELQQFVRSNHLYLKLTVWNESVAFFALSVDHRRYPEPYEMWVMDDDFKGAWTKHLTIEGTDDQIRRSGPVALWGDEWLMVDSDGHVVFFNLCTKKLQHIPIETEDKDSIIVYVNSIVSVMGRSHKLKSIENTCSDKDEDAMVVVDGKRESCRRLYSYSVWAIPPADVSHRIKKVMEGLQAEFGGPEIEPHIPILGSIQMMSREDALNKFRFAPMDDIVAKVDRVVTKNYYHQCVSLLMDRELFENAQSWSYHFGFYNSSMPYLSLLYGKLTEEERKKAGEIVNILDESITSLTFPITHFALYEIDYDDRSLKSWTKIAEIGR